jgi:uncharacterized protein (DUF697 family)
MSNDPSAVENITSENEVVEVLSHEEQATKLTKRYVLWSMGGSLVPVAFLDLAAIIAIQVKMLKDMSDIYEVPFTESRGKSVATSLIGSLGLVPSGTMLLSSLVKVIPGIGSLVSALSLPVMAGAITYATGRVFIIHFESGGTLLDFDAEKMKAYFKESFSEGQSIAEDLQKNAGSAKAKSAAK